VNAKPLPSASLDKDRKNASDRAQSGAFVCRSIGITGGIGAGKSAVRKILTHIGYPCVDADFFASEILNSVADAKELSGIMGPEILSQDGMVDRIALRQRVFADSAERNRLEEFMHPRIQSRWMSWRSRFVDADLPANIWIFYEAALLIEKRRTFDFDKIVVVTSSQEKRFARLADRGLSREAAGAIANAQLPDSEKLKVADHVIVNDGSLEDLRTAVFDMLDRLGNQFAASRS
jgi:dephospho-CoA kinase